MIQRSLAGGELAPAHYSRTDLAKYANSVRTLRNAFVKKEGGVDNRGGTFYVYGNGTGETIGTVRKLVPFVGNQSGSSYVLEFGDGFIRFTKNGALITVSGVTAWSAVTAYVVGDLASRLGINYYCILAHTNQQPPNATYWYPLTGSVYSIPTSYSSSVLDDRGGISYTQYEPNRMLITHKDVTPSELVRTSDTSWKFVSGYFGGPIITEPTSMTSGGGSGFTWAVTGVTTDGEESLTSAVVDDATPSSGTPMTIGWTASTIISGETGTISHYNVYRRLNGIFYYIGSSTSTSFVDTNQVSPTVDSKQRPVARSEIPGTTGTHADKCGTYQQRTLIANFSFNTQAIYASQTGRRLNFTKATPVTDDDSILTQTKGRRPSGIKALVDIGELLALTDSGQYVIFGNASGALTPTETFPKQLSSNPADDIVPPVVINTEAIYAQAGANIIRACGFTASSNAKDGFSDFDITSFASHLFKGKTVVSWAYQQNPHSILWVVLSDGEMAAVTYIKDQQILAWHTHDTDGLVKEVCSIPEGDHDALYMIVQRTINGSTKRYMERMYERDYSDIVDMSFMDSTLSYDGRNTGSTTMTLSGGTAWDETETLTLTASAGYFVAGDVGNEIWITGTDDIEYRLPITAFTSTTVVSVRPVNTIPSTSGVRSAALTTWAKAVDEVSGLSHLEAEAVSVLGNGYVVANPNNDDYTTITVTSGAITLAQCFSVIHVGLPYLSDIETLDIDLGNAETFSGKKILINEVGLHCSETASLWIGPKPPTDDATDPEQNLVEQKIRELEDWEDRTALQNDLVQTKIKGGWSTGGRVFIRNLNPTPMTINAIVPSGNLPSGG